MLINKHDTAPPAICWFIDRARVAAGKGPQRLEPTRWGVRLSNGGGALLLSAKGRRGFYSTSQCYTTEQHARDEAGRIARAEILAERSRHTAKMAKLEQVQRLARGLT